MRPEDAAANRRPVSVGVGVDLYWGPDAGGHVKCWERFAEQAALRPNDVDLTIYMLGDADKTIDIGGATRVKLLPAQRRADRYATTRGGGDTDLARRHRVLTKLIRRHDVLHATSPFAFGRTMKTRAEKHRVPFLYSIHTDHAAFARIYSERIIRQRFGEGLIARLALGRFDAKARAERAMRQRVRAMIAGADAALYSRDSDRAYMQGSKPPRTVRRLRRGVDASRFNPVRRNAVKLKRAFGVPEDALIMLFVGRIDETKGIDVLVDAARRLLDIGLKIHILAVGGGGQEEAFRRAIGPNASLPGPLPQETLATIYASADVFVFPSHTDVAGNVVLEAKSSGLPCFVLKGDGGAQFVTQNGVDGVVVPNRNPESWARVLRPVLEDGGLRAEMALAARRDVEKRPDWGAVFDEDLLTVWRALGRRRGVG